MEPWPLVLALAGSWLFGVVVAVAAVTDLNVRLEHDPDFDI